jgi:hypothetical protein
VPTKRSLEAATPAGVQLTDGSGVIGHLPCMWMPQADRRWIVPNVQVERTAAPTIAK